MQTTRIVMRYDTGPFELKTYINGLVQDCRNSNALAVELLQSFTQPSI